MKFRMLLKKRLLAQETIKRKFSNYQTTLEVIMTIGGKKTLHLGHGVTMTVAGITAKVICFRIN